MDDKERHQELADFLRTRRARLSPAQVGLAKGVRRRTPGLRREEVAELAGVGLTWYTWLEQGRDIHASPQVLESIARALQLDPVERANLFRLGDSERPHPPPLLETVSPALQRVLDSMPMTPAYIMGRRWDVLAWNRAACAVLGDFSAMDVRERNTLWRILVTERYRRLAIDWECTAQLAIAQFRASADRHVGDPSFVELIEDLKRASPAFDRWWARHDVRGRPEGRKEFSHPLAGWLVFEQTTFQVNDTPDLRLVLYTPLPEADTAKKVGWLLDTGAPEAEPVHLRASAVMSSCKPEAL